MSENLAVRAAQLSTLPERIGGDVVSRFGGVLRCATCRREEKPLGRYMAIGWPTCCHGHAMTWWTQRQLDAGEDV
jgi:hypothetical protein